MDAWSAKRALVERQQIVVPVAIRVRSDVRRSACRSNNTNIGTLTRPRVKDKERVGFGVDAFDNFLPRPDPRRRVSRVCDVLVRALGAGLCNACDLAVRHRPPGPLLAQVIGDSVYYCLIYDE